jgi:3-oxoacyl-[acyl-carrier-protein] synthase II
MSRIVITGLGLCTALGGTARETWLALAAGRSGIGAAMPFAPPAGREPAMALVASADRAPELRVGKLAKFAGRSVACGLRAAQEAVGAARLAEAGVDPMRLAVHTASGQTGLDVDEFFPALGVAWTEDPSLDVASLGGRASRLVDPYFSLRTLANGGLALLATEIGARGPSANHVHADTAGARALRAACLDLLEDRADAAVVAAFDSLAHVSAWLAWERRGLLSRWPAPRAVRPFDAGRDGLVLGEGAAALVLERAETARARGAPVLADLLGVGLADTAFDLDDPRSPAQLARAWARAFECGPGEGAAASQGGPALVVAHGLATRESDAVEAALLLDVAQPDVPITAFKGATGYLGAATALVETALLVLALQARSAPAIVGLDEPDPAFRLSLVRGRARALDAPAGGAAGAVCAWSWTGECAVVAVRAEAPDGVRDAGSSP